MKAAVVINPLSGTGGRPEVARRRAESAASELRRCGVEGTVRVSEYPGHARELARTAVEQGAALVIAWGGDGTINEVGGILAFGSTTLGIIPSGSGNGLARELEIPFDVARAFDIAIRAGRDRVIDAGELDGRLFFNVAGLGLDARVAHRFAAGGLVKRGFWRYLEITALELFAFEPDEHTVVVDGEAEHVRALMVAVANARQYGKGALIAPHAKLDDGRLDVVSVTHRSIAATMVRIPQVFAGRVHRIPGVTIRRGETIEITSARPVVYHVDGEPFVGGAVLRARAHPAALRVRVPHPSGV